MNRRSFLQSTGVAAAALATPATAATSKPAALGGTPVRKQKFQSWPVFDEREDKALLATLRSGKWYRGSGDQVAKFEKMYAELTGAKGCLATANGTSALLTSLSILGIGAGDEVIVSPYTFVATVNAILQAHAVPVFCDVDPETFQMDPAKIEPLLSDRTVAILPVHTGGLTLDIEALMRVAAKHNIPVIEDACQAHLSEWKGKKLGTFGKTGCFSFQASKNLNSGEGGAVLTNDADLLEQGYAFHNNSRPRKNIGGDEFRYMARGLNLRMTEFQAALLMAQMTRLEEQARRRDENAAYLTSLLEQIPGILPAKKLAGCTRASYHLYMFRYQPEHFHGLSRYQFLKALAAEGIPCTNGYHPLNREPFLKATIESRGFRRIYSAADVARWHERNQCPANDKLCAEAGWFLQYMLLGPRSDMEQIAEAVRKLQQNAGDLSKRSA
jgi:dTDP-4-amino-4,6-dideoxygalactose transaminase